MILPSLLRQPAITLACAALKVLFTPARRRPRPARPPRRILVLRRCCLGDVLMTTPLLRALDEAYPDATITYATGGWSAAAIRGNPRVDRLIEMPDRQGPRELAQLAGRLRRERFDLAVLPERSPLVPLVALLAGIPRRVGFDSAHRGFALTDPVLVRGVRHEVERALDLARALGIPVPSPRLEYRPGAEAGARVARLLAEHSVASPLLVIHPGGGANPGAVMDAKRWPPERFGAAADGLLARHGGGVILVGGSGDRAAVDATRAAMRGAALDFCGALDLDALAALCRRAALYVGNDSGATHLAEACGAPTVVVFGPTDPAMYGPVDGVGEAVWDPIACTPFIERGDLTR
ncbi:MAG: glycosyltransferase family 9 protein, partial [Chloroflexota bacterium]|nr:glycosyltransferase family 9 protein [Chloroflexota bacterium]